MDVLKAQNFALALTQLCREHGVMIWTAYPTTPIMASDAEDTKFFYRIALPEGGHSVIVERILT